MVSPTVKAEDILIQSGEVRSYLFFHRLSEHKMVQTRDKELQVILELCIHLFLSTF